MTVTLDIPPDTDAAKRERLAVALYDAHTVSQGRAAQIAGLSRAAFIDALGRHGVSPFQYDADEVLAELEALAERDAGLSELVQGSAEWNARLHSTAGKPPRGRSALTSYGRALCPIPTPLSSGNLHFAAQDFSAGSPAMSDFRRHP